VRHPSARPEILFVRRQKPESADINENTREAHVAFPGGRSEQGDEGSLYTAMRQTWEEIGLDLAESDYTCVGQLDDREITTSLGKRLLMILSPFVFLQLTATETPTEPTPETTLHWVPLNALYPERTGSNIISQPLWSTVTVDTASRLTPKHSRVLRPLMRLLVGSMQFPALVLANTVQATAESLDNKVLRRSLKAEAGAFNPALHPASASLYRPVNNAEPQALKLWGLSLGMTLDLLSYMSPTPGMPLTPWDSDKLMGVEDVIEDDQDEKGNKKDVRGRINAPPSLTSVFPRFSYPDVNFWIWVFGKRYRQVIRNWEATLRVSGANDTRVNWTGAALTTFYAAVRKALVVVLVLRAIGVLCGATFAVWWMLRQ
jgi:8-oxo-dGTP pyrophosphatase MutT (NUDIX family)